MTPLDLASGDARPRRPSVRAGVDIPIELPDATAAVGRLFTFSDLGEEAEHVALGLGPYRGAATPLVRLHSECLTGDVFGSRRCDCGPQLAEAIGRLADQGGYLLYLRQEGRGIGFYPKIDAYRLQDGGMDTFQANRALGYREDARDYTVAAEMLSALGVERIDLLTNNPDKVDQLTALGIAVRARIPTGLHVTSSNRRYLAAKAKAGHQLVRAAIVPCPPPTARVAS